MRVFITQHRGISLGALAVSVVFISVIVPALIGSGSGNLSDSSPCSAWSSANRAEQVKYARLYVREHGPLPTGARSPASIVSAINGGCTAAYAYDDADTVNVIQAINGQY